VIGSSQLGCLLYFCVSHFDNNNNNNNNNQASVAPQGRDFRAAGNFDVMSTWLAFPAVIKLT